MTDAIVRVLPQLGRQGAADLVAGAAALAGSWWMLTYPAALADGCAGEPATAPARSPGFRTTLTRSVTAMSVGLTVAQCRCGLAPHLAGKLPHGGVSERPKEHASKACDG